MDTFADERAGIGRSFPCVTSCIGLPTARIIRVLKTIMGQFYWRLLHTITVTESSPVLFVSADYDVEKLRYFKLKKQIENRKKG